MYSPLPELIPLYEVARENDIIRLKHLLEHPEIRTKLSRWFGEQCLKVAVTDGYVEIVRVLISLPSSVFDFTDVQAVEGASTYLIRAAFFGQGVVFKVIAETGKVNLSARDENGATPLHWASKAGSLSVVDYLLEQEGINPDEEDDGGRTPLAYAARGDSRDVACRLLRVDGVNPDAQDIGGNTPLYWATLRGNNEFAMVLRDSGRINTGMGDQALLDRGKQHFELQWL